jgi:uncharacterized metal-binding protein YceD (DUF177 family)
MTKHHDLQAPAHDFRRLVAARRVGESGLVQSVEASGAELEKIAAFLGILSLRRVTCDFRLTRWRARGIKVVGSLDAVAVQACVVTLEPVEEAICATFERRFLPQDMMDDDEPRDEVFVEPQGEDPPEPMTAEIDLGEIVVEELALNLNPYPRKEGSTLPEAGTDPVEPVQLEKEKPFAALAKLKLKPPNTP